MLDWTESHTNVPIVALDVVAAAAGAATAVAQSAARRALGIFGLLVPTLFSGLKEYNRITNDRTRMLRDAETGTTYEYQGFSGEQLENAGLKGSEKKRAKYEAKLGTTLYETVPVSKLLEEISNAKENGDRRALLVALATARSSVDYADFEKKGIISYTPGKMGDERLALDIAMIETEKSLSQEELKEYHELCDQTDANIDKKVSNKDKAFNRVRLIKSLKKSGRTLAFGAIGFLAGQEISAARDPAKIGLFEKYGPFKTSNNFNASETFLAKGAGHFETFFGGPNANGVYTGSTGEISQFNINVNGNNQAVMRDLEARGYTKTKLSSGSVSFREVPRPDSVAPAGSAFDRTVQYDGWARGATTSQVYLNNGQFSSGITGGINGAGQNLNYADLASAGRIKGYLTIGGAKLEVVASTNAAGQLTWGENGVFNIIAPDGTESTIKAISDSGEKLYKYFEVAVDNGVDADGIQHLIPLATDVGRNNFDGTIEQLTTLYEMVEHPDVYAFTKVIQRSSTFSRELDTSGILSLAAVNDLFQGRTNLGPATSQSTPNVV